MDARFNVVEQNAAHRIIFGDYASGSEREQNLIWRIFAKPAQHGSAQLQELLRVFVAQFRVAYGRFINDPWRAEHIAELNRISPEFRELWIRHDVLSVSEGHKTIQHSQVGELVFDFLFFQTVDSSDLLLIIYTPRSKKTADKIAQLPVLESDG